MQSPVRPRLWRRGRTPFKPFSNRFRGRSPPVRADSHDMDTAAPKRRLGDIFVERGLVTQEQLDEALAEQREKGGKLGEILVEMGYMTRIELAGAISEQWTDRGVTFSGRKAQEHQARA